MRTELFLLPECTDHEKEVLSVIIVWYLQAFPKDHPLGHSMYRVLLETLHWRLCHFVIRSEPSQERQGFTLILHEVYLLDFVLTLFLSAMRKPTKHGVVQKYALLYVKRFREQLRCLAWSTYRLTWIDQESQIGVHLGKQSKVALVRVKIDQAFQAVHRGLRGLADDERYDFVSTRISNAESYYKQLVSLVGPADAVAIMVDAWVNAEKVAQ